MIVFQNFDTVRTNLTFHQVDELIEESSIKGFSEGFEKGYVQGKEEALTDHEMKVLELIQEIEKQIGEIHSKTNDLCAALEEKIRQSVLSIFEALYPIYMKDHAKDELLGFIDTTLNQLLHKEELTIYVNPDIHLEGQFNIVHKESLAPYTCEIAWKGGGAYFSIEDLTQAIIERQKL